MNGWREHKGLFWKSVGGAAALGVVWGVSALVWGTEKREKQKENDRYLQELKERSRAGTPSEAAIKELDGRLAELGKLRSELRLAVFTPDGRFQKAGTRLDFDELSKQLRDSVDKEGLRITATKAPLGFDDKLLRAEGEEVEKLLRRLGVVKRFIVAARTAKVASVRAIKHGELVEGGEEGLELHRTVVPIQCVFDADERSLITLLHDLMTSPRKALWPSKLAIKVEERSRGTFRVDATLCAVFVDKGATEAEAIEPPPKARISPMRY